MLVQQLDHLNLNVSDLERSAGWYRRVFGFEPREGGVQDGTPWRILQAGDCSLALYQSRADHVPDGEERLSRGQLGINHFALRIGNRAAWEAVIEREHIAVDHGGAYRWPHSTSWYIHDPDGYSIEVVRWDEGRIEFGAAA